MLKKAYFDPIAKLLKNPVHLLRTEAFDFAKKHSDPGAAPGIENRKDIKEPPPGPGEIPVSCICYSEAELIEQKQESLLAALKKLWKQLKK